ncbi:hypothetical protein [Specibacter cremeus]|uniref:hypothetical protein n=1 Tax=Specibacter cremeus TaxID=1629051 RepID=UPI000F786FD0|nr:hypothetical protein [Specibacter cremeus]
MSSHSTQIATIDLIRSLPATPPGPPAVPAHALVRRRPFPPAPVWKKLGLTMLIPFFLAAIMGLAYLGAFHQPVPHHLPVAIVGSSAQGKVFAQTLKDGAGDALDVRTVPDAGAAKALVASRGLAAAYAPGAGSATLYVSSASSETTANVAQKVFMPIAFGQHLPLQVVDVVPAGTHDSTGQGLFFLLVALSIGGYASAIPLAGVMGRFRLGARFGLAAAAGAVVAAIGTVVAGPIYGVIAANTWGVWLFCWLYVTAIVLLGMGLHPLLRHWTTPALTLLFVALNFTSSGGIFSPDLQPGLFGGLNAFWNGAAWLHGVQTITYFQGQGFGFDVLKLALWLVPGVLLVVLTHAWSVHKTRLADENSAIREVEEAVAA